MQDPPTAAQAQTQGVSFPRKDSCVSVADSESEFEEQTLDATSIEALHKAHPSWATPVKVLVCSHTCACVFSVCSAAVLTPGSRCGVHFTAAT
jgi:hypothetical protein